jgi:hypothetical protein
MAHPFKILPGTGRGTVCGANGGGGLRDGTNPQPPSVSRRWRAASHLPVPGRI